jgi:hypothetical protein
MVMAQVSMEAALKKWGKAAEQAITIEMKQLHWQWIIFLLKTQSLGQRAQTNYCNTCNISFVLNLHCAG